MHDIEDLTALELVEILVGTLLQNPGSAVGLPIPLDDGDYILVCTLEPASPELTSDKPMVVH